MPQGELRLWYRTFFFTALLFCVMFVYSYAFFQELSILMLSKAVAGTGGFLIGFSFMLSSMCYYFDFLDKKIGYRKFLGVTGYYFALAYSIMLLFVNPGRYFYGFFDNLITPDFLFGLSAMAILTVMAAVSNNKAMMAIGPKRWRTILRFGYLAYGLLVIRAFFVDGQQWLDWFSVMDRVPPPRLVLTVFATIVLAMRISVPVHKKYSADRALTQETPLTQGKTVSLVNYTPLQIEKADVMKVE